MFIFFKKHNNTFTKLLCVVSIVLFSAMTVNGFQYLPKDNYLDNPVSKSKFDKGSWEKATAGIDYSGKEKKKKKEKKKSDSSESGESSSRYSDRDYDSGRSYETVEYAPPPDNSAFWNGFFQFFIIALAVVIVVFIIANLVGVKGWSLKPSAAVKKEKKTAVPITLENVEENIYESDLDRFIREALEKGNYSQAVRLYYLAIIKELSLKRWIRWKKDKTNREYIRELSNTNFQNKFRDATRLFERVWYGKEKLDQQDFKSTVQPPLKNLLQESQNASNKA